MSTTHAFISTTIGQLLLVAEPDALTGLYFKGHTYPPEADAIGARIDAHDHQVLVLAASQLQQYLAGELREFNVPVRTRGDAFLERVWQRLMRIPYGETVTYGAIASELGNAALAQRVGQAVGHNPISIIIPCHRVVGANGSLTGFAGGLERKRALLTLEEPDAAGAGRLF